MPRHRQLYRIWPHLEVFARERRRRHLRVRERAGRGGTSIWPGLLPVQAGREGAWSVAQDRLVEKTLHRGDLGIAVAPFVARSRPPAALQLHCGDPGTLRVSTAILKTSTARLRRKGAGEPVGDRDADDGRRRGCAGPRRPAVLEQRHGFRIRDHPCSSCADSMAARWPSTIAPRQSRTKAAFCDDRSSLRACCSECRPGAPPATSPRGIAGAARLCRRARRSSCSRCSGGRRGREPLIVNEIAPRVHNSGHWTHGCLRLLANSRTTFAPSPAGRWARPTRHSDAEMLNLDRPRRRRLAGNGRRARACASTSTASARPGRAARWATSTGCRSGQGHEPGAGPVSGLKPDTVTPRARAIGPDHRGTSVMRRVSV